MPLTVGGGVRTVEDIRALLHSGADKVSINTAAVATARFRQGGGGKIRRSMHRGRDRRQEGLAGAAKPTAGKSSPMAAATRPASTRSTMRSEVVALGAGEILLTSMDRDGTRQGFDIALTRAVADAVTVPVIASGGAGTLDHLVEGIRDGHATAVLAASIFHFGEFSRAPGQAVHGERRPADAARSLTGWRSLSCHARTLCRASRLRSGSASPIGMAGTSPAMTTSKTKNPRPRPGAFGRSVNRLHVRVSRVASHQRAQIRSVPFLSSARRREKN